MLAAVDVAYAAGRGYAAAVLFPHWRADRPARIVRASVDNVRAYEPGAFYLRELPCLLAVLEQASSSIDVVLIDGYVWRGDGSDMGLGAHLYEALARRVWVVGIAKRQQAGETCSIAVCRGTSRRPLQVTAAGLEPRQAAEHVRTMHGQHRIPTLLSMADRASRELASACL